MKHPEEIKRLFKKSDEEMLQMSELQLVSFDANKGLFVERFPQLANPFSERWATAINAARSVMPDYVSVANQSSQTNALEILMEKGRNLFQTLILCVRLAFPDDATVLRLMGQSQYNSAHRNQLKLPVLLRAAYAQASKPDYKSALINSGFTESEIVSLETLALSIIEQAAVQEQSKKSRSLDLNERIIAMNAVWEKMSLVCQCAKLVFQHDAARYALFLLSEGDSTPKTPIVPPAAQGVVQ